MLVYDSSDNKIKESTILFTTPNTGGTGFVGTNGDIAFLSGSIIPTKNDYYSLGSTGSRIFSVHTKELHVSGNTIYFEGGYTGSTQNPTIALNDANVIFFPEGMGSTFNCISNLDYIGVTGSTGPTGPTGTVGWKILTAGHTYDGTFDLVAQAYVAPPGLTSGLTGFLGPEYSLIRKPTGPTGQNGLSAYQVAEENGFSGTQEQWLESLVGSTGPTGFTGAQGAQGDTGAQGAQGAQGDTGAQGAQGDTGAQGAQGDIGAQGFTGSQGAQGFTGAQGYTGAQGAESSVTGPTGPQGAQGLSGVSSGVILYMNYSQTTTPLINNLVTLPTIVPVLPLLTTGITYPTHPPTPNPSYPLGSAPTNPSKVRRLSLTTSGAPVTDVKTQINSQNNQECVSQFAIYKQDLNNPTFIPPGIWDMNIFSEVSNPSETGEITLQYHLYTANIDSSNNISSYAEVNLGSSIETIIGGSTAINLYTLSLVIPTNINLTSWNALYVILVAINFESSHKTSNTFFEGTTTYSHIHTSFGAYGYTGPQGFTGAASSVTGPTGPFGYTGAQGFTGPQGAIGAQGFTGSQGAQGAQGFTGPQGAQGAQGAQGFTGPQGAQGAQGFTGPQGFATNTGATGPAGAGLYPGTNYRDLTTFSFTQNNGTPGIGVSINTNTPPIVIFSQPPSVTISYFVVTFSNITATSKSLTFIQLWDLTLCTNYGFNQYSATGPINGATLINSSPIIPTTTITSVSNSVSVIVASFTPIPPVASTRPIGIVFNPGTNSWFQLMSVTIGYA